MIRKYMTYPVLALMILLSGIVYADGAANMPLDYFIKMKMAETIAAVEILKNETSRTTTKDANGEVDSIRIESDIKIKVLAEIHGKLKKEELDVKYSEVIVKGVFAVYPGSGKEDQYKKGDKCIAFFDESGELIRLEDIKNKEEIVKLLEAGN